LQYKKSLSAQKVVSLKRQRMVSLTEVCTVVPKYAYVRADIAVGVLIFSTADELDSLDGCHYGIYHRFDMSFLFYYLRQNAANRANRFLTK
jgi:hypothetical protein